MFKTLFLASALLVASCSGSQQTGWRIDDSHANHPLKASTEWVAHSDGWRKQVMQAYEQAGQHAEQAAMLSPRGSWVVVMDLDQTVMNNIAYQVELDRSGKSFSAETWRDWVDAKEATLVPGAFDFIRRVNALGGHVAFVTNRRDYEQLATEENLATLGLLRGRDFRVLLTRAAPEGADVKDQRFALVAPMIASMGYPNVHVVSYVGDVKTDHPSAPGDAVFFCIPQGGLYGDPCELP